MSFFTYFWKVEICISLKRDTPNYHFLVMVEPVFIRKYEHVKHQECVLCSLVVFPDLLELF